MRRLVLLCCIVLAVLAGGCTGSGASTEGGYVSGDGSITRVAVEQRAAAPSVTGTTLDGAAWTSTAVRDRVLVYNVWGSWCQPCIKEAPALVAAADRTRPVAQFVGLNTRDSGVAQAQAFVRDFKVPYPNLFDPDGRLLLDFAGALPASAIPTTLIVDRQGRVAARVLGETSEATLVGLIEDVAAGR